MLPPSEFDALDTDTLKRLLGELRADTDRVARERAEAQVDRVRRRVGCTPNGDGTEVLVG